MPNKHEDTNISLHPSTFRNALRSLVRKITGEDSEAEGSGNTSEDAL